MASELDNPDTKTLNYFRYFSEVEGEFVRRRGSHMFVSTVDWALIESWKEMGIPLHVVLRGINTAFDGYESRPGRVAKVNHLAYCEQAVEEAFAEFRLSRVGDGESPEGDAGGMLEACSPSGSEEGGKTSKTGPHSKSNRSESSAFTRDDIFAFVQVCELDLGAAADRFRSSADNSWPAGEFTATIERARMRLAELREEVAGAGRINPEKVEADLAAIDRLLLDQIRAALGPERLAELKKEARAELRGYKSKMDKAIYDQTVENFVCRRLREIGLIPRLSLFYLL
ncbi:MAG TPA: hypothetical protein VEZ90_14985 [Blastocatellia bacterium]|nr:hypothetical protein [Blastocatellia bacterium]